VVETLKSNDILNGVSSWYWQQTDVAIFEALQQEFSHAEVEIRAKLNKIVPGTMWIKVT
jgi:hypothetical protein